jgi:uncharacterized protein (TIGR03083 family)
MGIFDKMGPMYPPQPVLVVDLFPELLESLLDLLRDLSDADWRQPTICAGWSVKDVTLHLLGGEIGNLSRRRDGHAMEGASINNWQELVAAINDWNERWVQASRRISPRLLVDLLELTGRQMCDYFSTLDPYALGGSVSWAGPQPAPLWLDIACEYTERWHHQQHIREAVGHPGLNQPRYIAPALATFVWALPQAYRLVHAAENTCLTLTITGVAGGRWSIVRQGEEWRLYQGAPDRPVAEVQLDAQLAWRLFTHGLSPDAARPQMAVLGDQRLGWKILYMVSIIA